MKKSALFLAALLLPLASAAQEAIKEGNWNITTVISGAGMNPQMQSEMGGMNGGTIDTPGGKANLSFGDQGMTLNSTKCITSQDPVPDMSGTPGCGTPDIQHSGNTISYRIACSQMSVDGTMTFAGDTLTGTTNTHQTVNGKEMTSTAVINGTYVGPCQ